MKSQVFHFPILSRISFILSLSLLTSPLLFSQLSGTLTIDLAGGGDYLSFTEAVSDLNSQGVNGTLTFNVKPGTYNEQFMIGNYPGASESNRVTFQALPEDSSKVLVTFTYESGLENHIIRLDSAGFITFKRFIFNGQPGYSGYGRIFHVAGTAGDLWLQNNFFLGKSTSQYENGKIIFAENTVNHDLHIENNIFQGGTYAIGLRGLSYLDLSPGLKIKGNTFNNQSESAIQLTYYDAPIIENNYFYNSVSAKAIDFSVVSNGFRILRNKFELSGGIGIYTSMCYGSIVDPGLIANNFICVQTIGNDGGVGVSFNLPEKLRFYHNSILISGTPTSYPGTCLSINSSGSDVDIQNNIFANLAGGYAYSIYAPEALSVSDYNNYYGTGEYIAILDGDNVKTLQELRALSPGDDHSVSVHPAFLSDIDLHTTSFLLDNVGNNLSSVVDIDIDGESRSSIPDIGADEFTGTGASLAGIYTIGGSSPDYSTIAEAVDDLNKYGITDAVNFQIRDDNSPYNEQIRILPIGGIASDKRVTFQPDPANTGPVELTCSYSSSDKNYIMEILGSGYLTLKDLVFSESNLSNPGLLKIGINCRNDSILNCVFNGGGSDFGDECISIASGTTAGLVISSNQFSGGYIGISIQGSGGNTPSNFLIDSNYFTNMYSRGIDLSGGKEFQVMNNEFYKTNYSNNYFADIVLWSCREGYEIKGNRMIHQGGSGIFASNNICTLIKPGIIANNFISFSDETGTGNGINIQGCQYLNVFYNTILREGDDPSKTITTLILDGGDNIQVKNNIFCNLGDGPAVSAKAGNLSDFSHNSVFTAGKSLVNYDGTDFSLLSDLESSLGSTLNCLEVKPYFLATKDYHTNSLLLDGSGVSIPGILKDLDGDIRNDPPDIGADEFTSAIVPIPPGTYTIGGITPDYSSIRNAINDLQLRGISGSVVFRIRKGNYPEIPGKIYRIPGSGPESTIILESETGIPEDVVIYGTTTAENPDMFNLISADNLTIKGLTISPQGTQGHAIGMTGIINKVNILNNVFISYNTTDHIISISARSDDLLIKNNDFNGGRGGIHFEGSSNTDLSVNSRIINNKITGALENGMELSYQDSPEIIGNSIIELVKTGTAIYLSYCDRDIIVNGNYINLPGNGTGIALNYCRIKIPFAARISNNQIHIGGNNIDSSIGILMQSCDQVNLYYNSIHISGGHSTYSSGIKVGSSNTEIKILNNNVYNSHGGFAYQVIDGTSVMESDYNNYYTTGSYLANWESTSVGYLIELRSISGKESNSLSQDPLFHSNSDLHSNQFALIGKATPINEVTVDFDSLPRDPVKPDIGAYEYSCITPDFNITMLPSCLGDSSSFIDGSTGILPGSSIGWDFNDDYIPEVYSDDLNDTIKYLFEEPGTHRVNYIVSNAAGCLDSKDFEIEIFDPPELSIVAEGVYCDTADGKASVSVLNGEGPYDYYWSTGSQDTAISGLDIGYYSIVVTDSNNCLSTEEIHIDEAIEVEVIQLGESTCGKADGIAEVLCSGGFPPYRYVWTDGDTTAIDSSLTTGLHFVNVIDSEGCYARGSVTIENDGSGPQVELINIGHAKCYGDNSGAIDIKVIGGASPYRIKWTNGEQTEDIYNLATGIYNVKIEDAEGCIGSGSFEITQPLDLTISVAVEDATCTGYDGKAAALVSGGTKPFTYNWINGGHEPIALELAAGIYSVKIVDANGCEATEPVIVNNVGGPLVNFENIKGVGCNTTNIGEIQISVSGEGPYTYEWSPNGEITPNLSGLSPGAYGIKVTDKNGCIGFNQADIKQEPPPVNPICLVTVDSVTEMNMIVWEKLNTTDIAFYNIYREGSMKSDYELIGSRHVDSLSLFVDSVADPTIHSWRYKLSVVDVCGNESELSDHHKTIHLTMNLGLDSTVNLIWDEYEGFNVKTYDAYRYSSALDWQNIASLSSNLSSYTDKNPPKDDLFYYIKVTHPSGCTATDFKAATLNTARSNRKARKKSAIVDYFQLTQQSSPGFSLYPNPGTGVYYFSFNQTFSGNNQIRILDISGKILSISNIKNPVQDVKYILDLSTFENGIYQVVINSGLNIYQRIIIKE